MGYRDDTEAAYARAAALERELAAAREDLDAKAAQLAAKDAELAETKAALADHEREAGDEARRSDHARRKLDRLHDRGREPRPEPAPPKTPDEASERDLRMARSVSAFAESDYFAWLVAMGLPGFYLSVWLFIRLGNGLGMLMGVAITTLGAWALWTASKLWARSRVGAERAWAESRPYELHGYPAVLARKPQMHRGWPANGHSELVITLAFDRDAPASLGDILRGFDDALTGGGSRYRRPSPVTTRRSRAGVEHRLDSNAEVRRWVHRLDDKVLGPLREVHGLHAVTITLS